MDLLLEAAGLRGEGGNQGEETKSSSIREEMSISGGAKRCEKGTDEEEDCEDIDLSSEEEYESSDVFIAANDMRSIRRKRRLTDDGGGQTIPNSRKLSCIQHNENERKRRKSMKYAVHSLRDQLTRKTRKAAVNTVLLAAFEEIQDLKRDEEEKEEILEELKSKNIVLKYLLKKEINELKQQQSSSSTSSDILTSPRDQLPSQQHQINVGNHPHSPDPKVNHHNAIFWQWQHSSSTCSSSPPAPVTPSTLPPPPPLISADMISSPSYVSSPPPAGILIPSSIPSSVPPMTPPTPIAAHPRIITYPISPVPDRHQPPSNHIYSPVICSPSPSFFPYVPIPAPSFTIPPLYYPAAAAAAALPNTYQLHLTTSTPAVAGFPVASSTTMSDFLYNAAIPTAIQPPSMSHLNEVKPCEPKAIELKSPLQSNSRHVHKAESMQCLGSNHHCEDKKSVQLINTIVTDPHRSAQVHMIEQVPNPSIPSSRGHHRGRHSSVIIADPSTTNSPY